MMVAQTTKSRISTLANLSTIAASRCGKKRIGASASLPQAQTNATNFHPQHTTSTPNFHQSKSLKNHFSLLRNVTGGNFQIREAGRYFLHFLSYKCMASCVFRQV
jgi:hypothetical protein